MVAKSLRHVGIEPAHPGALLGDVVIPSTGRSKTEIARLLGVSRQTLYDVIKGEQAVTPALAVRLGKLFGNGPHLWLNMQQAHDLWSVERSLATELQAIRTLNSA
jgi:addiction module HigA family antidote